MQISQNKGVVLSNKEYKGFTILEVFATGVIPDGYFGKTAQVKFAYDAESGNTIAIWSEGHFTYSTPPATDIPEAYWLLINHPSSNATRIKAGYESI